jgi:hypothetical protein
VSLVEQELLNPIFSGVRVAWSLVFCVVFCRSLFVPLSFFFWPLYYLSFYGFWFPLWYLQTLLIYFAYLLVDVSWIVIRLAHVESNLKTIHWDSKRMALGLVNGNVRLVSAYQQPLQNGCQLGVAASYLLPMCSVAWCIHKALSCIQSWGGGWAFDPSTQQKFHPEGLYNTTEKLGSNYIHQRSLCNLYSWKPNPEV